MNIELKQALFLGGKIVLITIGILAIGFFCTWIYYKKYDKSIEKDSQETTAVVIKIYNTRRQRNIHLCQFNVNGENYQISVGGKEFEKPLPLGTKLRVRYYREDPSVARIVRPIEIIP